MNNNDLPSLTLQNIPWASDMGRDSHGLWAEFTICDVTQRMRWIGPGRFLMGSPENEPGRLDDEKPQHDVRISAGFWLFDTPVTQALWATLIGDNPSYFVDPKRPVENVSWDDAMRFLKKINAVIPGLDLILPTEAQWEYACRAGTNTATYAGSLETLDEINAPILGDIAWYSDNSGVDFELAKQYKHNPAGTHPVALKLQNQWGLYDMLGNVWEWCADYGRSYSQDAVTDPLGDQNGTGRALRGGSWGSDAFEMHAAFREADDRDSRDYFIGFRCARVRP